MAVHSLVRGYKRRLEHSRFDDVFGVSGDGVTVMEFLRDSSRKFNSSGQVRTSENHMINTLISCELMVEGVSNSLCSGMLVTPRLNLRRGGEVKSKPQWTAADT
ncbi:hypothetical protein CLIB1444_12S02586 [[Candida] jaroonii]|uniref:Uncharacterized protein n=1 Tax=[Candida] jaroonii TaxID=467808 RepID=A0ACA9YEN2_9ASCO|nr:hypothetical protein CLIB1444_12S02586 [[Candida] jaroonii]